MGDTLTFYTNPMSRGRMVRCLLEEMGVAYDTVVVEYGPEMKAPGYLAINPMGKVPAIRHGETVVTETGAIMAYLPDAYPETGLAPPVGDPARGAWLRWLFFAAGPMEQAAVNKALGVEVPEDKQVMAGYGSHQLVLDVLEKTLTGRRFLAGERFTSADLYLGISLWWGMGFGTIEKRAAFEAYCAPIMERDAMRRAMAKDDALMPPDAS